MSRIGFALGYGPFMDAREIAARMKQAEDRGFEMGFFSETIELMRDSVSVLASIGLATSKLILGSTQIVGLRSAVMMGETLATLDELTRGRMTLAPGACTKNHAKVHSLPPADPPQQLREYIEAMRLILSGQKTSYHGTYVSYDNVGLGWEPCRPHVPLYCAATSKTGLRLAGQIADGVVLNAACSPEYTVNAIKILSESAEAAGRDFAKFEICQIINCSVDDDHGKALDAIRWEIATKFDPVQLAFNAGPRVRVGEPHIRMEDVPGFEEAYRRGGMEALVKAVPDSYVEGLTASGTPAEVMARVQRYRDAGVKIPLLRPATADQATKLQDLFAVK
jgi:alkanesulfonate monooxygenase SsuD/methylene tetrahydromethanopterin reductase-like flavin-dependent oxidoreductase (luciferase family)